jgi:hypothetical protein
MKKVIHSCLTALVLLALTLPCAARVRVSVREDDGANKLTPDEEREARELAASFLERLRQTDDVAPLVEELFVSDFDERIAKKDKDYDLPMAFVSREVALQASPEELRRFYVAEFNRFSLILEYYWFRAVERSDAESEDEDDDSIEKMFPPDVVACLKDDPLYAKLIEEEQAEERARKESAERDGQDTGAGATNDTNSADTNNEGKATEQENQPDQEDEDVFVKSLADLHAATNATEKTTRALRAYVPSLIMLRQMQRERNDASDSVEIHDPDLDATDRVGYGFPAETRFIHIHVEPLNDLHFFLVMVKADGRLRILYAFPVIGD